jgi:hypothetical protein
LKIADPVPLAPLGFGLAALLVVEDAQFRRPVRQCQQQPVEIRIASEQFGFDGRDLAAATFDFDSQGLLYARCRDLPEGPAVVERCFLTAQRPPPGNYYVGVLRIKLKAVAHALR